MNGYYDRAGNPVSDVLAWAKLLEDRDYRSVASDMIGDVHVSTVWLGLDHGFADGPPLIFETMIFGGDNDQYQERYTSEEEALAGHAAAVALVAVPA